MCELSGKLGSVLMFLFNKLTGNYFYYFVVIVKKTISIFPTFGANLKIK